MCVTVAAASARKYICTSLGTVTSNVAYSQANSEQGYWQSGFQSWILEGNISSSNFQTVSSARLGPPHSWNRCTMPRHMGSLPLKCQTGVAFRRLREEHTTKERAVQDRSQERGGQGGRVRYYGSDSLRTDGYRLHSRIQRLHFERSGERSDSTTRRACTKYPHNLPVLEKRGAPLVNGMGTGGSGT